ERNPVAQWWRRGRRNHLFRAFFGDLSGLAVRLNLRHRAASRLLFVGLLPFLLVLDLFLLQLMLLFGLAASAVSHRAHSIFLMFVAALRRYGRNTALFFARVAAASRARSRAASASSAASRAGLSTRSSCSALAVAVRAA